MHSCEICNITLLNRNKTKHFQSKKLKYDSNLLLNRYVIINVDIVKFKDVFNPYFTNHSRKFDLFEVYKLLRHVYDPYNHHDDENPFNHEIKVSNIVFHSIQSEHYTTYTRIS